MNGLGRGNGKLRGKCDCDFVEDVVGDQSTDLFTS